jgi:pilus assembly protein Flp/PilA
MNSCVFCNLLREDCGQDLIEYALVAAIIGLAAIAAMSTFASNINNAFSAAGSRLSSAIGS